MTALFLRYVCIITSSSDYSWKGIQQYTGSNQCWITGSYKWYLPCVIQSLWTLWMIMNHDVWFVSYTSLDDTIYLKKYAHGFVVLCFFVVMQSFIMNSHEVFIHIHQGCFAGTGAIVRLPQCQWSKPDGYGKISQCITTTKHSKAKTVCIFLGIYCIDCDHWWGIVTWNINGVYWHSW